MLINGDPVIVPSGIQASPTILTAASPSPPNGTFTGVKENEDGTLDFDIREQTVAILRNVEAIIKHATGDRNGLESIIDATVFLPHIKAHYAGMNAMWNEFYPDTDRAPARTAIGVKELPSPKMIVEIKCIALVTVEH
ncbi:hypothetical protein N7471_001987 [Penicillium samsonianum]|uniref:uncharacterized protein n=1 Tax=Penicillium samsonianum TaxID=1882272 RepID=UPI0025465923|nr:uncharacterized protein N7471_001987 [Penicillium samsonianum]KAJ6142534.1 hypothetical protein N7471_001987 [Penicillium samsonianum]